MPKKPVEEKIAGNFTHKHILSLDQFDTKSLDILFKTTEKIIQRINQNKPLDTLAGKIISLLFFEPSSRTFSSFSSAAKKIGAQTVEYQNMTQTSSVVKGESLEDTVHTFESYSDMVIMRHPEIGSVNRAASVSSIPVINAGDGGGEHPTQTLLDLFTIYKKFYRLDNLTGVMGGDPLHSRTIRSLAKGLSLYKKNILYFLSPKELRLSSELVTEIRSTGTKVVEIHDEKDIPATAHFWYWNRIQKERFKNKADADRAAGKFIVTLKLLQKKGNKHMIIMDPLPRVDEIAVEVDHDPRAMYFAQMKNGWYVRMALLSLIFGEKL